MPPHRTDHPARPPRAMLVATLLAAALGPSVAPARAALVVDVQSVAVAPGTRGNALDVTLTNTGPGAVAIAGFSLGLSTTPGIAFTEANTSVASYIFAGNSLFGPIISTTPPPSGTALLASDNWATPNAGFSLAAGATVGLARVLFDAAAAGTYPATLLAFPSTSLSGPTGADLPIATLRSGVITVGTQAIPEPASIALLGLGLGLALVVGHGGRRWRHRPRQAA